MTTAFIHPTAVVDEGAVVGEDTKVWHFCHVSAGARIGRRCVLGQNVFVASTAVVEDGCRIQNNVSLYDGVELADDVFVGPSVVFTNVIDPRAFVSRKTEYRATAIGRGATLGANATLLCGNAIGPFAFVGAGAVVTKPVAAHALVLGVPARVAGWVCRCGRRLSRGPRPVAASCADCGTRHEVVVDAAGVAGLVPRP